MVEMEDHKKRMEQISVEATVENIGKVTDFANEQLERYDCLMKAQMQIDIAIDELFGNIVHELLEAGYGTSVSAAAGKYRFG